MGSNDAPIDRWVYRDGKVGQPIAPVVRELSRRIALVAASAGEERRRRSVDALVVAGELETALADAGLGSAATIARATDALASEALGRERDVSHLLGEIASVDTRAELVMSPPEGFAYYALHPEAYALAIRQLGWIERALVVGIRSIGTTLAAVARAALIARGASAERVTVRPGGHVHDRRLARVPRVRDGATVVIVDEGPGLSGSTFLAAAEAFERAGVPRERIVMVCSHAPDTARLCAPDAAARWRAFRSIVAPSAARAPEGRDLSGGAWRSVHYARASEWPASFVTVERRKVLDGQRLFKYEGLGVRASAALDRVTALAARGLVLAPRDEGDGWWSYAWTGRPLARRDVGAALLDRLARYIAERARQRASGAPTELSPVVTKNARALGIAEVTPELIVERPAIVDGRLAPHEWVRTPGGEVRKTDAAWHGDDHFFPGPTDIAWDLAGAIVEWELDEAERAWLLERYRAASGDDAGPRIAAWIFAYATYHAALASFARDAVLDEAERARLAAASARYMAAARRGRVTGFA